MPVERSRRSRRAESDGQRLIWNPPIEPADNSGISFAPNVTPVSFTDVPPLRVDSPPLEVVMFSPSDDSSCTPRRSAHSRKKPRNHIPRPPNAFILFRSSFIKSQHVSTEVETNHSTLSKIIGLTWQNLPEDERQVWHDKAKVALEEHKHNFPKYAFKPTPGKRGGTGEKRKVREVEPKDMKRCAKIAELLAAGIKGQELEAAMIEFDKYHVPEFVTRFEVPITATTYRRSSSAPIPDTENSKSNQSFFSTVTSAKQMRALSTCPARCPTPGIRGPAIPEEPLPKEESSFDFTSFSFDQIASPLPTVTCNPLFPSSTDSFVLSAGTSPIPLDTDITSFLDKLNQCMTPTSSDFLHSSSPSPLCGVYGVCSEDAEQNIFDAFPSYQQYGVDPGLPNEPCLTRDMDFSALYPTDPILNDIDFSALMNLISDPDFQI